MRPATHSTDDPPCKIDNIELAEYIASLRRRIEILNDQIAALATELKMAKHDLPLRPF